MENYLPTAELSKRDTNELSRVIEKSSFLIVEFNLAKELAPMKIKASRGVMRRGKMRLHKPEVMVVRSRATVIRHLPTESCFAYDAGERTVALDADTAADVARWRREQDRERDAAGDAWEESRFEFTWDDEIPGQNRCAARDLNPEPADYEFAPEFDLSRQTVLGKCRDVLICARADRVYEAGVPGAAGPYRDIRASTEPARMAIGLDQSAETGHRGRWTILSPEGHNVTVALKPSPARPYSQVIGLLWRLGTPEAHARYMRGQWQVHAHAGVTRRVMSVRRG